jgi:hypothetical protein
VRLLDSRGGSGSGSIAMRRVVKVFTICHQAMGRMNGVIARLNSESSTLVHPILETLANTEWIAIDLRHAALHLGFQVPK